MPFDYNNATDEEGIRAFFQTMYRDEIGFVHLSYSDPADDTPKGWHNALAKWPEEQNQIVSWCIEKNALGMNVYFCPALFDPAKTNEKKPEWVKENVLGSFLFWFEYDGNAPPLPALEATESDATLNPVPSEGTASEAGSVAGRADSEAISLPHSSLIVQSGHDGHEHHYLESTEFITDSNITENVNRRLMHVARADASGWDITQSLRVPYTNNYKYPDRPPVTVSYVTNIEYTPAQFNYIPQVPELLSLNIDENNLPAVEDLLLKYSWDPSEEIKSFIRDVPTGERSDALMRWAYICAEKGLDEVEIYAMVENADRRWGKYVKRSDRKKRILDIVNRALIKHPKSLAETTFDGLKNAQQITPLESVIDIVTFVEQGIEIPPWIIEGFLEYQGTGMVASAPGIGKTQLSMQLAYQCAIGKPFLHWNIPNPLKVLFFELEMSEAATYMFAEKQLPSYRSNIEEVKLLKDNFFMARIGQALPVGDPNVRGIIRKKLDEVQPQLLIFDSLGKLTNGKLDEENTRKIFNFLNELKEDYDCSNWLVHHNRKATADNKRPKYLEDIYGSQYITADVSTAITLWREHQRQEVEVIVTKLRTAEMDTSFYVKRGADLLFSEDKSVPNIQGGEHGKGSINPFGG